MLLYSMPSNAFPIIVVESRASYGRNQGLGQIGGINRRFAKDITHMPDMTTDISTY
jgi:hypothetical protein